MKDNRDAIGVCVCGIVALWSAVFALFPAVMSSIPPAAIHANGEQIERDQVLARMLALRLGKTARKQSTVR